MIMRVMMIAIRDMSLSYHSEDSSSMGCNPTSEVANCAVLAGSGKDAVVPVTDGDVIHGREKGGRPEVG